MCRIAGYFGPPIAAAKILSGTPHSLEHQSRNAREMHGSSIAGDGWGIGWFTPGDRRPAMLKSILPLWSDLNAQTGMHAIISGSLVGHIRYASPGIEVCFTNTPLYPLGEALWTVNGELSPWPGPLSKAIRDRLHPEDEAALRGSTDAEMLGGLWRTCQRQYADGEMASALRDALRIARDLTLAHDGKISVNVLIGHASGLIACRYADREEPNSLYTLSRQARWQGASLLASEPLDDGPGWKPVPASSLVVVDEGGVRVEPLGLDEAPRRKRQSA